MVAIVVINSIIIIYDSISVKKHFCFAISKELAGKVTLLLTHRQLTDLCFVL